MYTLKSPLYMANVQRLMAVEFRSISKATSYVLEKADVLVVCSSREEFLQSLTAESSLTLNVQYSESAENRGSHAFQSLDLFKPTISLIAKSRRLRVVFARTLMHLRAYLSAFNSHENPTMNTSNLAILNLLQLHRLTSEYSAQGISRTLALIVDTISQNNIQLKIIESVDNRDGESSNQYASIFKEHVPILNGSQRSIGDGRAWVGRTVETGAILAKWCKVARMSIA